MSPVNRLVRPSFLQLLITALINSSLVKVYPLLSNQRYKLVHYYETYLKCQTKKGACIHLSPY